MSVFIKFIKVNTSKLLTILAVILAVGGGSFFMFSEYLILPMRLAVILPLFHCLVQFNIFGFEGKSFNSILISVLFGITIATMVTVILILDKDESIVFAFQFMMYTLFSLVHKRGEFGAFYEKLTYITEIFTILLFAIVMAFPNDNGIVLYQDAPFLRKIGVFTSFGLGSYALILAFIREKEIIAVQKSQTDTINWFSTLINLVNHNLRTPLANIKGNIDILMYKEQKLAKYKEISRVNSAVNISINILDRLLKASFVNERTSQLNIQDSINVSYPSVLVNGKVSKLYTYEQNVSIHLALEVFIDNALKYTDGKVIVSFDKDRIIIQDEGPGLSEEAISDFASVKSHSVGSLHGIGIPFAARLLDSIGMSIYAANTNPGLRITISHK